jgi:hypothetical protein
MAETLKTCSSCKYECRGIESDACFDCLTDDEQEQIMTNWEPKPKPQGNGKGGEKCGY